MKKTESIFFFTNIPAPYNIPLYENLSKKLEGRIHYFFDAEREENRKWKIDLSKVEIKYDIKNSIKLKKNSYVSRTILERTIYFPFWIIPLLMKYRPEKIVTSEFGLRTIFCRLTGYVIKAKVFIISDVTLDSENKISFLQKVIRKLLAGTLDGGIAKSIKAKEYLLSLGFLEEKLVVSPYAVYNEFYIRESRNYSKQNLRKEYGFNQDDLILFYSGQFIHRKGIDLMVKNISLFNNSVDKKIKVILAGGNDFELGRLSPNFNPNFFLVVGFLNKIEIIKYFILADYFILPSRLDTWGIVVNESLACGCPTIVSKYAGSAFELVHDNVNGFVFDPLNHHEFQTILKRANVLNFNNDSEAISRYVSSFNYENAVNSILKILGISK